jgi:hypothetical protein
MLITFLISGCVRINIDLKVSVNDRISGSAIIALSDALTGLAETGEDTVGDGVFTEL